MRRSFVLVMGVVLLFCLGMDLSAQPFQGFSAGEDSSGFATGKMPSDLAALDGKKFIAFVVTVLFMTPFFVAMKRMHPGRWSILLVNTLLFLPLFLYASFGFMLYAPVLFFGLPALGFVVCMVWALKSQSPPFEGK